MYTPWATIWSDQKRGQWTLPFVLKEVRSTEPNKGHVCNLTFAQYNVPTALYIYVDTAGG
jgi:hypothetical protein